MANHRLWVSLEAILLGSAFAACLLPATPARAALVSRYNFEDLGTPTTAEDSASGHDGTVYGGVFRLDSRIGSGAMEFGSGRDVRIPYHADFDLSTYSVSAWVKIPVEQGNGGILGTRFSGDTTFDVKVRGSDVHGDVGSGSGWINTSVDIRAEDTGSNGQGGDLPHDTWQMITYVIDDGTKQFRLYIDDDLKRTIGYSGTPRLMKGGQEMRIGNSSGTEYLSGLLDDVRIYDHALTQAEIAALASQPAPPPLQPIPGLYNTGVDDSGVALVGGDPGAKVTDPHYDVIVCPGSAVTPYDAFVAEDDDWPIPPWLPNDADSRWIDPNGEEDSSAPGGQYTYRTTFTLPPDTDLASVLIAGSWGSDNTGTDILINGLSTAQTNAEFGSLSPFILASGFVKGVNTLDFVFSNASDGPTALRVDGIVSTYRVPEPATCVLALGLLGLGWYRRRRRAC